MRSLLSMPAARISSRSDSRGSSNSAAAKRRCRSRSVGTPHREGLLDLARFADQYIEWWQIRIPLDEARNAAEAIDRRGIQFPHRVLHRRAMGIDEEFTGAHRCHAMSGQMD